MVTKSNPILQKFYSFLVAAILANLASTLSMIVDSIIAGQILGPVRLAAITSLQPVNQLVFALTVLLNTGCAMLVAYALGEKNDSKIRGHFTFSMLLNAVTTAVMLIVGLCFIGQIAHITSNDPGIYDESVKYGRILISTSGVMVTMFGLNAFVRTDNAPKLVTVAVIVSNVVNLTFDIIFMKYLNMGIEGAAWASVLGYVVGIGITLLHFREQDCKLAFGWKDMQDIAKMMALFVGLPLFVDTLSMFLRILFVNNMLLEVEGVSGLAIQAVSLNMLLVVNLFLGGCGQALQGVGGASLGAGDGKSFKVMVSHSAIIIAAMSIIMFAVIEIWPEQIIAMFNLNADNSIQSKAVYALRLFAPCMPGFGLAYIFEATCLVRKQTLPAIIIAFFHTMTVAVVMFIIVRLGTISIWHSFWIGETIATILSALTYYIYNRKM